MGKALTRDELAEVAQSHSWQRVVRTLRQDGWDIKTLSKGYRLDSPIQLLSEKSRVTISEKLRYQIIHRDLSTCQRCGRTIKDGITLQVDHKIPVDWGGTNDPDNLWTLCDLCNRGKKHFFSDYNSGQMKTLMAEPSAGKRLRIFFELNPNIEIPPYKLDIISQLRDWTRRIRKIRKENKMNIIWLRKTALHPNGAYIYRP